MRISSFDLLKVFLHTGLTAIGSSYAAIEPLRIVRSGVKLGTLAKGRFVPEHHLFMAYGTQCANRETLTLHDPRLDAWLKGEEIEAKTAQKGWCAVLLDGMPLGFGKMSGGKIKKHYPKALRKLK